MQKITILSVLLSLIISLNAQNLVKEYNNWLEKENLSEFIFAENTEIIRQGNSNFKKLNLKFNTNSKDTALSYWKKLNEIYSENSISSFPELLFYHYLFLEKSQRPDTLVIELKDEENCLKGFIYLNDSTKKILDTMSTCLAQTRYIPITADEINLNGSLIELDESSEAREAVYNKIINFSKQLYTQEKGFYNNYSIKYVYFYDEDYLPGNDSLKFTVGGIKQEVLGSYGDPFVCWLLSYFYDEQSCHPWEYLKFSFHYNGFKKSLIMKIEGKISDGMTKKPTTWRRAKPMEPQFKDYLKPYASKYKKALYYELKN